MPVGLLSERLGIPAGEVADQARRRAETERAAVDAVMATERRLGRVPSEMPPNNKGYDIESRAADGALWFIEVKGRVAGAESFFVTRSEIGVGRNKPENHILALVEVVQGSATQVRYLQKAFQEVGDLPFSTISVNLEWLPYFERGRMPDPMPHQTSAASL